MEIKTSVPNIFLNDIERMVKAIRMNTNQENVEISFDFMLATLFPTCWNNIQKDLNNQYALGYIAGVKDTKKQLGEIKEDADYFCD